MTKKPSPSENTLVGHQHRGKKVLSSTQNYYMYEMEEIRTT